MASWAYNRMNPYSMDNLIKNYVKPWAMNVLGYNQKELTQDSINEQIGYEQYLRAGYERQLADWNKNVGSKGRTIRYPELAFAGKIRGIDTAVTRLGLDYDIASANYSGNLVNKSMGLYSVPGRLYRSM